ncbi:UMP kinase [bacterium]|nr:UMP kinase [candidate division CSSED10-310 bacterium]
MDSPKPLYRRILLKISGEVLGGFGGGFDPQAAQRLIRELTSLVRENIQVGIVCGGGNIFRGYRAEHFKLDRIPADAMGMLATMINGIALTEFCRTGGLDADVMSAWPVPGILPEFSASKARTRLGEGAVVVFCGGTGRPYFSTDTAAALRALEIKAEVLIKGTKVEGVHSQDPAIDPDAELLRSVSYDDVIAGRLKVMDLTSITLCRDHNLPVRIFNMTVPGNLFKVVTNPELGTLIS